MADNARKAGIVVRILAALGCLFLLAFAAAIWPLVNFFDKPTAFTYPALLVVLAIVPGCFAVTGRRLDDVITERLKKAK
jgi:hypothetical protein